MRAGVLVFVSSALAILGNAHAATKQHVQTAIRNGEVPCRAVNLGGWLLGEAWMSYTSPMWKNVPQDVMYHGEYAVMQALGEEEGTKAFESHWSSWITEDDIAEIAKAGLNTVRVPIGHWIINDDPEELAVASNTSQTFARGGLKYLDKLINEWAVTYDIAVMVSLHAHQGSQNGYEHSAPTVFGKAMWAQSPENVARSLRFATFIAKRYQKSPAFLGLTLMNEPIFGQDYKIILGYYKDAYKAIRATGNDCIIGTAPWIGDQGPPTMMDFLPCPEAYNVWHEWHIYYKWGYEKKTANELNAIAMNYTSTHFRKWHGNPIFESEWSLATDDSVTLTKPQLAKFAATQLEAMNAAASGWAFWSWRHSDETKLLSGWSLRQMLKEGIVKIPKHAVKVASSAASVVSTATANANANGTIAAGAVHGAELESQTRKQMCLAGVTQWGEWTSDNGSDASESVDVQEEAQKLPNNENAVVVKKTSATESGASRQVVLGGALLVAMLVNAML